MSRNPRIDNRRSLHIISSTTVILSFMILNVVLPSVFNVLSFDRTSDCDRKAFVVSLSSFGTTLNLLNCG